MLRSPLRLCLLRGLYEEMVKQAQAELPNECCGLLAGTVDADGTARAVVRYPLTNELASATEYQSDANGMLAAVRDMRGRGIDVVAVYHSHPTTQPVPSEKDRERNYSETVVNFIIGLAGAAPEVRGWWVTATDHREAEWAIV